MCLEGESGERCYYYLKISSPGRVKSGRIVNFPHFLRAITFKYGPKADVTGMISENSFLGSLGDRTGAVSLEPLKSKMCRSAFFRLFSD